MWPNLQHILKATLNFLYPHKANKRFYVLYCLFRFILALPFRPELLYQYHVLVGKSCGYISSKVSHFHKKISKKQDLSSNDTDYYYKSLNVLLFVKNMRQNQRYTTQQSFFVLVLKQIILQHNTQDPHDEDYIMAHLISSHLSSLAYHTTTNQESCSLVLDVWSHVQTARQLLSQ